MAVVSAILTQYSQWVMYERYIVYICVGIASGRSPDRWVLLAAAFVT